MRFNPFIFKYMFPSVYCTYYANFPVSISDVSDELVEGEDVNSISPFRSSEATSEKNIEDIFLHLN